MRVKEREREDILPAHYAHEDFTEHELCGKKSFPQSGDGPTNTNRCDQMYVTVTEQLVGSRSACRCRGPPPPPERSSLQLQNW
ncbi:hypothetical protein INR49_002168 [Caranx melampygus]|nr:hypothetical protein INR49_002168 [Caranx melampygus]